MTIKTKLHAGRISTNHNETAASGLRVRTAVKAGKVTMQDFHFVAQATKASN